MSNRQLDEEAIFQTARLIENPEGRTRYLDQICAGDVALRERVEGLLRAHEQDSQFLKSNPLAPPPTVEHSSVTEAPGQEIGRYKLLQQIGEGGFGVVYMAEQSRPMRRKVALKVIKPGMDSKAVIARFEAERQALAMMDHPNIARVFDGGVTDSGRPYFVMELVKGIPITQFCDSVEMPTEERLKLFITVCQAVQHAHQKGIIHRDLKPSNILVTLHDDEPVVKVIDFGVAKAINQQLTEKTLFTTFGNMIGTPQYMSPEQAALSGLDVDTRSDVYSLGVLLYELLTGSPPLETERLRTADYAEVQRLIREEEPPKPSTRLSNSGERLSQLAKQRGTTPKRLRTQVRSEVDWIVMKALEKDRKRRYETCNSLADDVARYLNREPVLAYPPSMAYRLRKFVSKNRSLVAGGSTVLAALLLGLLVTVFAVIRVNEALTRVNKLIVERALLHAMNGELDDFNHTIELAEQANVPQDWVLTLKGLASLHRGDTSKAIDLLEQAITSDAGNVSAQSLLAIAYYYSGNWHAWSQHVVKVKDAQPRPEWRDFDNFFLGYTYFYIDYDRAANQFDLVVKAHRNWLFARAMRATAWAHQAWMNNDPELVDKAFNEIEIVTPLLPDTPFILLTRHGVYIMAIARGSGNNEERLRALATETAKKLDEYPDFLIATFVRADDHNSIGDEPGAAKAREFLWASASGFLLQPAFERRFAEERDSEILARKDESSDAQLMKAIVHAWNGRKLEAVQICDSVEKATPTWQARVQILWVLLLCEDFPEAQSRCKKWVESEPGINQAMSINRESIEFVANYKLDRDSRQASEISQVTQSKSHEPQITYLRGLIAYSQSNRAEALDFFRRSLADGDARFVTHFARAFRDRLSRQFAAEK